MTDISVLIDSLRDQARTSLASEDAVYQDAKDHVWLAMSEFFSNHYTGDVKLKEDKSPIGLVSTWREAPEVPLIFSVYLCNNGKINLYIEAFLQVPPPNWSTTISLDCEGDISFDSIDKPLGESPTHYKPILIPNDKVGFLANFPYFQIEMKDLMAQYQRSLRF